MLENYMVDSYNMNQPKVVRIFFEKPLPVCLNGTSSLTEEGGLANSFVTLNKNRANHTVLRNSFATNPFICFTQPIVITLCTI